VKPRDKYEELVSIARRRGFFWPSYEIYGGVSGFIDLGPLGTLLKRNIENKWREFFIHKHQDFIVEIETPVIGPSIVFEASGHVESFTDPIVECLSCHRIYRADHLVEEQLNTKVEGYTPNEITSIIREKNIRCPSCDGELSEVKTFNLLFKTTIGPYRESLGYLRPEAAQGMFTSFKRVFEAYRNKIPIGVAQIGRVSRNEISPRQGMIRLREFTIMEVEFFFDPEDPKCPLLGNVEKQRLNILTGEAKVKNDKPITVTVKEAVSEGIVVNEWLAYFMALAKMFLNELGISDENQVFEEKLPYERAHYSTQTFDQLVKVSRWGWIEVSGHSYRGDYDLSRHMKFSGQDLTVFKRYDKPVIVEKEILKLDIESLKRDLSDEAKKIVTEYLRSNKEELAKIFKKQGYVEIAGTKLNSKYVTVDIEKEKITGKRYIPHVVEPSFGAERLTYVTLEHSLRKKDGRTILSIPIDIAPIQVAIFPLVSKEKLISLALEVKNGLIDLGFKVFYDESGAIGRRYARADEAGVPVCITVDYQSVEDHTVTLRDRDTWNQVRTSIEEVYEKLPKYFKKKLKFNDLGVPVKE